MREDVKTRAAERTVMIPDIAMPAVRRLINGDRGDLGYATWRKIRPRLPDYLLASPPVRNTRPACGS
jgi:hypothetical protein